MRFFNSLLLICLFSVAHAEPMDPDYIGAQPGFYDVEQHVLENGLRVILKKRGTARNASIRLRVDVGTLDFPCGKRETAHFLEHLLFTGTSEHTESELDGIITRHGGSWNAVTYNYYTTYEIDIFSHHTDVALTTLHEIITDPVIKQAEVEKSRQIIYREQYGKTSRLMRWLRREGIVRSAGSLALNHLFPGITFNCADPENIEAVTYADILAAYWYFYVPTRMTLVVVGDIDPKSVLAQVQYLFSDELPGSRRQYSKPPPPIDGFARFDSRFSPVIGSDARITIDFRTDGNLSDDYAALYFIERYFTDHVYDKLRVKLGLAYSPYAEMQNEAYYGLLRLETDARLDDIDTHLGLMQSLIDVDPEALFAPDYVEYLKRKLLLGMATDYEANSDFADYYASNVDELVLNGHFDNVEQLVAETTAADVVRAYRDYIQPDNMTIAVRAPTFTDTQFYIGLAVIAVILTLLLGLYWHHRRHHHRMRRSARQ